MFIIKEGCFYLVGYEESTDEFIYSTSSYSAKCFEDLEDLDKFVDKHKISGYAVTKQLVMLGYKQFN